MMESRFRGIFIPTPSPCDENEVFQEERFSAYIPWLYEQGVAGLYLCGSTGDGYRMRLAERKRAVEVAVEQSRSSGGKVIVHVGTLVIRDALGLAEHAASVGADAVSSMPLSNCTQRQLVDYYSDLAKAAGLPVFVYHYPRLSNLAPTFDEMVELLDIDGVAGLKLTDWDLFFMRRLLMARPDIIAFNGADEVLCLGLLFGAHGGIGTWYNVFPRLFVDIYKAVQEGDAARAVDLQCRFAAFADVAWKFGLMPVFEHVMHQRGHLDFCFRRPRESFDEATQCRLNQALEAPIAAIEEVL